MEEDKKEEIEKKEYMTPIVRSESLNVFGASCNGTNSGGRKASAGMPENCNASKLNSE